MNKYAMTIARQMLSTRDVVPVSPDKSDRIRAMLAGNTAHMERWMPKQAAYDAPVRDIRVRTLVYGMGKQAGWWADNWHKPVGAVLGGLAMGGLGSLFGGRKGGLAGMLIGGFGGWNGMDWLHQNPTYRKWFEKNIAGNPTISGFMQRFGIQSPLQQANTAREKQVNERVNALKNEQGIERPKLLPVGNPWFQWLPWSNHKRNKRRVDKYHEQIVGLKNQANTEIPAVEGAQ